MGSCCGRSVTLHGFRRASGRKCHRLNNVRIRQRIAPTSSSEIGYCEVHLIQGAAEIISGLPPSAEDACQRKVRQPCVRLWRVRCQFFLQVRYGWIKIADGSKVLTVMA